MFYFDRCLYFINSYSSMPSIMTSSMSGDTVRVLINSELMRPMGLTIDYNMGGRLFWSDWRKNVIESCNWDGTDRLIVVNGGE